VATLLRATPAEFRALKAVIETGDSPIGWLTGYSVAAAAN